MAAPPALRLSVVIAGHVDHGKSTVVGRLLADAGALPEGRLELVRTLCERTGRAFEYAFLLDALKDERSQGITIDTARVFFRMGGREYLLLDAPGHVEFVRNLVTGASRADAALLVVDAREGIRENSRRHGYLLGLLGIRQVAVVVNKMDLVGFREAEFRRLAEECREFLTGIGIAPMAVVPAAAVSGANLAARSPALPWHEGPTVRDLLESFAVTGPPVDGPFRMPVQDVYKFTADNDHRRIVAGTVESGRLAPGAEVVFYPSGKRSTVARLEAFAAPAPAAVMAGEAAGFTLRDQVYITRGELACRADEPRPHVTSRLRVGLFWLGREPLVPDREYLLKLGTARVPVRVEAIHRSLDAATLEVHAGAEAVPRHAVAECTLRLAAPVATDLAGATVATARFVIVDGYDIAGGGLVREALPDAGAPLRDRVFLRNAKWETSVVPPEARAARYRQRPTLLLVTGPQEADRKQVAKALEARLFEEGQVAYYIGMANVLYGVDADLGRAARDRAEHLRRLAEVAHLMLDAGLLLLVSAAELSAEEVALIGSALAPDRLVSAWLGAGDPGFAADLVLDPARPVEEHVAALRELLHRREAFGPAAVPPEEVTAPVVWLTGLPASGKTTLADAVAGALRARGRPVERLDGDRMRELFPATGFSRAERDAHVRHAGFLASRLATHGVAVVASFVSPWAGARASVRAMCPRFVEVHVSTPLAECERRDPRGQYAKARRGELPGFTGVDDPYEPPEAPEVAVDTSRMTREEAVARVLAALDRSEGLP